MHIEKAKTCLSFERLQIDVGQYKILLDNEEVTLSNQQFQLLLYLAKKPGRVYTYEQIYETIWQKEYAYDKGNVMAQIRHIREKIQPDDSYPQYIENIRGVGYRFNKDLVSET